MTFRHYLEDFHVTRGGEPLWCPRGEEFHEPVSLADSASVLQTAAVACRSLVSREVIGNTLHFFDDGQVLREIAALLAQGRLEIIKCGARRAVSRGAGTFAEPPATDLEHDAPKQPASRKKMAAVPEVETEELTTWVEIELLRADGSAVAGGRYVIELPDGSLREGSVDSKGLARVEGIDPGSCRVLFPGIDARELTGLSRDVP